MLEGKGEGCGPGVKGQGVQSLREKRQGVQSLREKGQGYSPGGPQPQEWYGPQERYNT